MIQQWLLIGLAGSLGAVARYGLAGFVQRIAGNDFPWGTAVVNVLGSFLFGMIWSLTEGRIGLSAQSRTIILTGFMGAFTTFSTFMFETNSLLRSDQWHLALANIGFQIALGLACLYAGLTVGERL